MWILPILSVKNEVTNHASTTAIPQVREKPVSLTKETPSKVWDCHGWLRYWDRCIAQAELEIFLVALLMREQSAVTRKIRCELKQTFETLKEEIAALRLQG